MKVDVYQSHDNPGIHVVDADGNRTGYEISKSRSDGLFTVTGEDEPNTHVFRTIGESVDFITGRLSAYGSTADNRVVDACPAESTTGSVAGGAFRARYRSLSDAEKALIDRVKIKGEEFFALLAEAGGSDPATDRLGSANLTLAFRHVEDAVYRTVKHITA